MGFCKILTASVRGLKVEFVYAEADVSNGLPGFHMVGYLSSEVKEAAERVRTAIRNMGLSLPPQKMVVNLSPANVRKRGTIFDLPAATALLAAMERIPGGRLENVLLAGELGLDGKIHRVDGILPIVLEGKKRGIKCFILPEENAKEGALVEGVTILAASTLQQVVDWVQRGEGLRIEPHQKWEESIHGTRETSIDYSDILGQESVKRATLVAVAGNHNLLYVGPPGAGKTMLAKRIPTILPEMTREESMEITKIYSAMGLLKEETPLITERPFREVHHTVTRAALVGGGKHPAPGECTLAHGGVLFLDELTEFSKSVLEALRQPLEEKCVHLARQQGASLFPADFMLVAAMNPCPCGYYPDYRRCSCSEVQIQSYLSRVSQPFLDRIDICVEASRVEFEALSAPEGKENSKDMRRKVEQARQIQKERFQGTQIRTNSMMGRAELERYCSLSGEEAILMGQAFERLGLTARSYHKILKTARTVADLEASETIRCEHLAEAIGYRTIDRKYWR